MNINKNIPVVWALLDPQPGTSVQSLGVAEKLGWQFVPKPLVYGPFAHLPNLLLSASLSGADHATRATITAPWPDIVIAAGRRTAPIARYIKAKSPKTILVQIMWPGIPVKDFDLIVVPEHDKTPALSQIMRTTLTPHRLTKDILQAQADYWWPKLDHLPRPYTTVLIGGQSKDCAFTPNDAHALLQSIQQQAKLGSLLVTTSRRTSKEVADFFAGSFSQPHYFHRWQEGGENPYVGLLGLADQVMVTGDSISMCSEAIFTGKTTIVFTPAKVSDKHKRFHLSIAEQGLAYLLPASAQTAKINRRAPLDAAETVADAIRKLWASKA